MILNLNFNSYETKSDKSDTEGLWADTDNSKSIYSKYKKVTINLMGK